LTEPEEVMDIALHHQNIEEMQKQHLRDQMSQNTENVIENGIISHQE
jgi:hypothetical protein